MNRTTRNTSAFTLIELLMVIAIIGILAGILIPTVGAVKKQANIAASKAQLSNYVNAIGMFKSEYKFYPDLGGTGSDSVTVSLGTTAKSTTFIETMSGRDVDGLPISPEKAKSTGNRRKIGFHSFSESEFWMDDLGKVANNQLADRFNNKDINIVIDSKGDGFVKPSPTSEAIKDSKKIRTPVTAYVEEDKDLGNPAYALWN